MNSYLILTSTTDSVDEGHTGEGRTKRGARKDETAMNHTVNVNINLDGLRKDLRASLGRVADAIRAGEPDRALQMVEKMDEVIASGDFPSVSAEVHQ